MTDAGLFTQLRDVAGAYILPRCLHVVANLGVADALEDVPQTASALAASVQADADSLARVLALLASHGIFEAHGDTFRHTPISRLLRRDHPQSIRPFVQLFGMSNTWAAYEELEYSVRTGRSAMEHLAPGSIWADHNDNPEAAQIFNAAMTAKARRDIAGILGTYDFSSFGVIGDIGGGMGHLLRAILASAPKARGILFELPNVVASAQAIASERLTLQAGSFFENDLPVCDAYLLMEVIHNWDDAQSVEILKAIRRAAPAHAKLLLIEAMIPNDPGPNWTRVLDIHMLTLHGGRQRTRPEYESLLNRAGFAFAREIPAGAETSVIEAVPI